MAAIFSPNSVSIVSVSTGYRLAAEVNRQHSECVCMSLYTHTLRVLPIHFGRETVPSVAEGGAL